MKYSVWEVDIHLAPQKEVKKDFASSKVEAKSNWSEWLKNRLTEPDVRYDKAQTAGFYALIYVKEQSELFNVEMECYKHYAVFGSNGKIPNY
jgi:hypothetical protein